MRQQELVTKPHQRSGITGIAAILLYSAALLSARQRALAADLGVGKITVGISPLYAYVVLDEKEEPSGAGCVLSVGYQLTEAIALQALGLWSAHDVPATEERPEGALHMFSVAAGGRYALDMLPFAPALEVGAELLHRRLRDASATDLALLVGVSARHWVLDWLALGAQLYYHAFLTDLRKFPIFVNAGPNIAVRF